MDWLGSLLIALTLGSLQLFVEWVPQGKSILLLVMMGSIGVMSALTLIWWERKCDNPILPLDMFKNKVIGPVFALSMIMGFCLFAIMYYAPLLFQGGFKLSPNQAGMLITPLAVFITVGSIINGRIMTRLKSPNIVLLSGVCFFLISTISMTQTNSTSPHWIVASAMGLSGLGIGLLFPNLTLIVQSNASRSKLGVVTAMLQSTRMVGSMLGAAVIGALISNQYKSKVNHMLETHHATQLAHWLDNPQILFSHELADKFVKLMPTLKFDAANLLAGAEQSLIDAVHESQWLITLVGLLAFWLVYKIPVINIHHQKK
jgi:MFS family permease